jgi:hypothetical protein
LGKNDSNNSAQVKMNYNKKKEKILFEFKQDLPIIHDIFLFIILKQQNSIY